MVVPAAVSRRVRPLSGVARLDPSGDDRPRRTQAASPGAAAVVVVLALVLGWASPAMAADTPVVPPQLDEPRAVALVLGDDRVAAWLRRYPPRPATNATFDAERRRWTVRVWSGRAGQVVDAVVDDRSRTVTEAWVGPQVAWKMARGRPGAFGGRTLTSWPVWLGLSLVFLLGLADLRRPLSLRNLDLLVLLSFGVSLGFFDAGRVFASSSLAVPPLIYLLGRTAWIGFRSRPPDVRCRSGRRGRSSPRRSSSSASGSG